MEVYLALCRKLSRLFIGKETRGVLNVFPENVARDAVTVLPEP